MKLTQRRLGRPSLGGMMATRQGSLTLALLCAAVAAGILMFALGRYKTGLKTTVQQATVLVATGQIHKGTSGQMIAAQKLYRSTPVVASQVAAGAISDSAALAGQTAQVDILPGQQLVAADFAAVVGLPGVLAPGHRALSVSVDEAHGATDILQAGDTIDVYGDFQTAGGPVLVLLDSNVLVLKPASAVPVRVGGTMIAGSDLELDVTSAKAPQFIYALNHGALYLSLRPLKATSSPSGATTLASILAADGGGSTAASGASTSATTTANSTTTTGKHP